MKFRAAVLVLLLVLIGCPDARAGSGDGWRMNPDILSGGAPVPDRRPQDRPLSGEERARIQVRLQLTAESRDLDLAGGEEDLFLQRTKLITAWQLGPRTDLRLMFELKDGHPDTDDWVLVQKLAGYTRLWFGQFKSGLSRSFLSSSGAMLFPDRAMAVKVFASNDFQDGNPADLAALRGHGGGRRPGIRMSTYFYTGHGDRDEHDLGFRLRAEVGAGNLKNRVGSEPSYTLRLEVHPHGNPSYEFGNYDADRDRRLSLDLSYARDPDSTELDLDGDGRRTPADEQRREITNLGWLYRRTRFSTQAEFFRQWQRPVQAALPGVDSGGFYVQLGWVWHPLRWESGFRWSQVDPDRNAGNDARTEKAISLVRYIDENLDKVMLEVNRKTDAARPGKDELAFRVQYQTTF